MASPQPWLRHASWCAGAVVALHALLSLPGLAGVAAFDPVRYLSPLISPAFAAVACATRAASVRGRPRWGWAMLGTAMAMWCTLQSWFIASALDGNALPELDPASAAGAALVPFLTVAALLTIAPLHASKGRCLFDGLIISGSLLYLAWAATLRTILRGNADQPWIEIMAMLSFPAGDIAVAVMAFLLMSHSATHRTVLTLLCGGALCLAIGDSSFVFLIQRDAYALGDPIDVLWTLALFLFGAAAVRDHRTVGGRVTKAPPLLWLPYVPLGAAMVTSIVVTAVTGDVGLFLFVLNLLLVLLVIGRQLLTMRENARLNAALRESLAEVRAREAQLQHMAYHDALTGLPNRARLRELLTDALADPAAERTVGVLFVDLDGFKQVNDLLGHEAGDELLVRVAGGLRTCLGRQGVVVRLGGDEFAVLLERVEGPVQAMNVAAAVVSAVAAVGADLHVTASVGVALATGGDLTQTELLRRADLAMYTAKMSGKSRAVLYEPASLLA